MRYRKRASSNSIRFQSEGEYNGKTVPVMHACGHDTHTAILMGTAEILASIKVN
jgi:metal-dependent amidase/aminoacylase/carboxypeptidase family protein